MNKILYSFFWVILQFRRREIAQKREYNLQNMAKVWSQKQYIT